MNTGFCPLEGDLSREPSRAWTFALAQRLPLKTSVEPAQPLVPAITLDDLTYVGSGIRAKLHPPEDRFADFMIRPATPTSPSLLHAAGIDSPGLTSCLAVGARVAALVNEALR